MKHSVPSSAGAGGTRRTTGEGPRKKAAGRAARTAVLAAIGLLLLATAAGAQQGPRISVAEPRYDFGVVAAGTVLEHVFEIRNAGDGVLEIGKIVPS